MTTLGMNRISRCTSRMCSRPDRMRPRLAGIRNPRSYWYPSRPRMRWSPPQQNAQPPSLALGPLPVSSTTPIRGVLPGVVERGVQFVDGVRPECVAHLRPVERHPRDATGDVVVVGDIREGLEARDGPPEARIEQFGNRWRSGNFWHAPSLRVGYSGSAKDRMPVSTSGLASTLSTAAGERHTAAAPEAPPRRRPGPARRWWRPSSPGRATCRDANSPRCHRDGQHVADHEQHREAQRHESRGTDTRALARSGAAAGRPSARCRGIPVRLSPSRVLSRAACLVCLGSPSCQSHSSAPARVGQRRDSRGTGTAHWRYATTVAVPPTAAAP